MTIVGARNVLADHAIYLDEKPAMANRHHIGVVSATAALLLLAGSAMHPACARLPWAATSGLHFVEAVINADNYRAKAGGLAMKKSPSPEVRAFGRTLWLDSIEDTRRLQWLLNQTEPGYVLPSTVSPPYMFVIDELLPVSGNDFDRRYIAQQTASLSDALALAEAYARYGDDFDLKEYAKRSAPVLRMRLDRVREIGMRQARLALR
jgi:putative membrane protein